MLDDEDFGVAAEWTPARGMIRGVIAGAAMAGVLGTAADLVAWYVPPMAANGWLRTGAAVASMWLLYWAVHKAAGMTGRLCTLLVVGLVIAIAVSQHVVLAVHGLPTAQGTLAGWEWLSPIALVGFNIWTLFGICFGVVMWRDGVSLGPVVDILRIHVRG